MGVASAMLFDRSFYSLSIDKMELGTHAHCLVE